MSKRGKQQPEARRTRDALVVVFSVIALMAASNLALADVRLPNRLQDFLTLSLSIFVEAFPFLVLGSLLAAGVTTFVSSERIQRILPKQGFARRAVLSVLGFLFPVCECGNVPLSRGLIIQGLKPSDAVTFLLAAPVLNPVTIWSTWAAFGYDPAIVFSRVVATLVIANIIGYILSKARRESDYLTKSFQAVCDARQSGGSTQKRDRFTRTFSHEAYTMLRMLAFGAIIAGVIQTFVPRDILVNIGSNVVLSIVAMLALAFVVSICANVDAFFALSFANTFSAGSLVSFLVFGPMIDIKMLALLKTTFTARMLSIVSVLALLLSALTGLVVTYAL